jgi:hypothetical protein
MLLEEGYTFLPNFNPAGIDLNRISSGIHSSAEKHVRKLEARYAFLPNFNPAGIDLNRIPLGMHSSVENMFANKQHSVGMQQNRYNKK